MPVISTSPWFITVTVLREAEHAVDVVLDDQDRNIGGDVLDEVRDALALGGGKARQRLVQQQHLRLGAERDAEIDQPLPAIGQFAALDGLDAFEAEEFDQLRGLGVDLRVVSMSRQRLKRPAFCACSDSRRFS